MNEVEIAVTLLGHRKIVTQKLKVKLRLQVDLACHLRARVVRVVITEGLPSFYFYPIRC